MDKFGSRLLLTGLMTTTLLLSPTLLANKGEQGTGHPAQSMHKKQLPVAKGHIKKMAGDKLNINTASAREIAKALPGIGLKKAQAIIDYRNQHGNFESIEQLLKVKGIGKKSLEASRNIITIAPPH